MILKIDQDKCIKCKKCINVCHTECMSLENDNISINFSLCSTCGQCVAICPETAILWNGFTPRKLNNSIVPNTESLLEMLKARRTTRFYKDKEVEKEKLDIITKSARYAPTNNYDIDLIVVQNTDIIKTFEKMIFKITDTIYKIIFKPGIIFNLIKLITPSLKDTDKIKMENSIKNKNRTVFHNAPVLIVVTADSRTALTKESCHYSIYNMVLVAQSLGLGTSVIGSLGIFLKKNKKVKRLLGIPKDKSIQGALVIGYTNVKFENAVEGYYPEIKWI